LICEPIGYKHFTKGANNGSFYDGFMMGLLWYNYKLNNVKGIFDISKEMQN
jgi:K+-transporting ATPase A subunit